MRAKDYRQKAWQALSGNWGNFAIIFLLFSLIIGVAAYVPAGSLFLTGPLTLGLIIVSLKLLRTGKVEIGDMFEGFKNFISAMTLYIVNSLLVFLWMLLLIIPGIIMSYAYSMSHYILADNPDMGIAEARKASIEMMKGHKWRLFCLNFSFFGWMLLVIITFGIAAFWIGPYMQVANATFYEDLKTKNAPVLTETLSDQNTEDDFLY